MSEAALANTNALEQFVAANLRSTIDAALRQGISPATVVRMADHAAEPALEAAVASIALAGRASPAEGYLALVTAKGGCMTVEEARERLGGGQPFTRQAVNERIKRGAILAAKTPAGLHVIPRWQFGRDGNSVPGFPEVLQTLKENTPGYSPLAAFSFFLQPSPMLGNKSPIAVLTEGPAELQIIKAAAREFARQ